jgi:polysaccharide biosynthesis transport protein
VTTSRGERATEATRTITGRDVFSFLRRGMSFAVIVALIAGGTAFIVTSASSPVYRATVVLLASQPAGSYGALDVITPPQVDPSVYRSALLEGPVLADALRRVEGRSLSERELELFSRKVRVSVDNQQISSVVRIEVRDEVPEYAARVANVIAEELSVWDRERARQSFARSVSAIERAIQDLEAEITAVDAGAGAEGVERAALVAERDQRLAELSAARTMGAGAVVVGLLEPMRLAAPPERPVGPRVVFSTLVAMLAGLVGGYGVLFARWSLDTRVAGRDDVIALTGLPVLAEFPRRGRRAHRLAGESGRFLRTNVLLATGETAPRVIAVTSPQTPAEKEGVAVSLAESFAKAGYRTLLIDGDLRHPATSELLDVELLASSPWEDVELANPYQRYLPVTVGVDAMHAFDFVPSFASAWYRVDVATKILSCSVRPCALLRRSSAPRTASRRGGCP